MNWIVVLVLFAQGAIFAFLVWVEGWSVLQASLTVIGFVVAFPVMVTVGLLLFATKQTRREMLLVMRDTIQNDLRDIARWIGLRL